MIYYLLFWTLLGFIIHFYIIFGSNLLTGGPAQNCCFCLFQSFVEKEYQTESKRNETFGNVIFGTNVIQRTWSGRQATNEEATRQGARLPPWARPPPSWAPHGSPVVLLSPIYIPIYPKTIGEQNRSGVPPPQPSVPVRSHLGAFSGVLPEGALITEGFYINTISSPMMCE